MKRGLSFSRLWIRPPHNRFLGISNVQRLSHQVEYGICLTPILAHYRMVKTCFPIGMLTAEMAVFFGIVHIGITVPRLEGIVTHRPPKVERNLRACTNAEAVFAFGTGFRLYRRPKNTNNISGYPGEICLFLTFALIPPCLRCLAICFDRHQNESGNTVRKVGGSIHKPEPLPRQTGVWCFTGILSCKQPGTPYEPPPPGMAWYSA